MSVYEHASEPEQRGDAPLWRDNGAALDRTLMARDGKALSSTDGRRFYESGGVNGLAKVADIWYNEVYDKVEYFCIWLSLHLRHGVRPDE